VRFFVEIGKKSSKKQQAKKANVEFLQNPNNILKMKKCTSSFFLFKLPKSSIEKTEEEEEYDSEFECMSRVCHKIVRWGREEFWCVCGAALCVWRASCDRAALRGSP